MKILLWFVYGRRHHHHQQINVIFKLRISIPLKNTLLGGCNVLHPHFEFYCIYVHFFFLTQSLHMKHILTVFSFALYKQQIQIYREDSVLPCLELWSLLCPCKDACIDIKKKIFWTTPLHWAVCESRSRAYMLNTLSLHTEFL